MTHIEAIANSGYSSYRSEVDGFPVWSNGHIAVHGDFTGRPVDSMPKTWALIASRTAETIATLGVAIIDLNHIYRELLDESGLRVWIDEAYLRCLASENVTIHIEAPDKPIAFRLDGRLIGIVMPFNKVFHSLPVCEPTDEQIFASFACAENDFYMQSKDAMRARLAEELKDARDELRRANEELDEAQGEVDEYESEVRMIELKIVAINQRSEDSQVGRLADAAGRKESK